MKVRAEATPSLSWRICVKEPNLLPTVNSPTGARAGGMRGGDARPRPRWEWGAARPPWGHGRRGLITRAS